MKLSPDKLALTVLYYLYAEGEPDGDADGISKAIGNGLTPGMVSASLDRLVKLGLVVWTGPMPMFAGQTVIEGHEWCGITHEGHDLVFKLIRQPRSFMSRLHAEGYGWIEKRAAEKAKLSVDLSNHGIREAMELPAPTERWDWSKSGAVAAWLIIPITIVGILVMIYLDS